MSDSISEKKINIVVEDPNVWISILIGSKYSQILDSLNNPQFHFLICQEMIDELKNVTQREQFRKWFTIEEANALIDFLQEKCENIPITVSPIEFLRDTNDSYLINLAIQGKANILVSNDKDITSLKGKLGGINVMTLAEFYYFTLEYPKKKKIERKP